MIQAGETFENPRTGPRLEARESTPQRVVFDRRYPPNTGRADPHVHFDITQSWEILSGEPGWSSMARRVRSRRARRSRS